MFRKLFSYKICRRLSILFCCLILFTSSAFASTVTVGGSYTTAGVDSRGNVLYSANKSFVDAMNSLIDSSAHNLSQNMRMLLYTQNTLKPLYDNIYSELYNLRYQFTGDSLNDYQGVNSMLNSINTQNINIYGSTSATNVHLAALRNELKNIDWISANVTFEGWFLPDGTQITNYSVALNYPIIKARFVAPNVQNTDLFNVSLGIEGWYQIDKASFIKDIYLQHYDSSGATVYPSVLDWHIMRGSTGVSILSRLPNNGRFEIVFETQKPYFITNNGSVSYLDVNSLDYYTVSNNNLLRAILNKNNQSEVVEAINNKQLETDVNVSINNSITDNDLSLDIDLPTNATNDTSNLLNKLKRLMLTGVATNQLLNALDDVELHAWYSQSNKAVVEAINNQYTSLYD